MNEDLIAVLERIARALEGLDQKLDEMTVREPKPDGIRGQTRGVIVRARVFK